MRGIWDWLFGEQSEARQLNRDARAIIEAARVGYRPEVQRDMSLATGTALGEAHARGGDDPAHYKPIISHFKMMHRDAKHARNQVSLTAYTLVIIYLRAEQLGELASEARAAIDEFIEDWAHAASKETAVGA